MEKTKFSCEDRFDLNLAQEIIRKIEDEDYAFIRSFKKKVFKQNVASNMIKIDILADVRFLQKSYHWLVKIPNQDPNRTSFQRAMRTEEKEITFYANLLPEIKKFIAQQ